MFITSSRPQQISDSAISMRPFVSTRKMESAVSETCEPSSGRTLYRTILMFSHISATMPIATPLRTSTSATSTSRQSANAITDRVRPQPSSRQSGSFSGNEHFPAFFGWASLK